MSVTTQATARDFINARHQVAERIARGTPAPPSPRALLFASIETIAELFQQRRIDALASDAHIQTLARAIKPGLRGARQAALEPLTVYWIGDAWCVVDGHHRLAAYRLVSHPAPVPVEVLQGVTLGEAIKASLGANSKDTKELSLCCKTEAAWRFVVAADMSKADIAALSDVAEATVATMRKTIRDFQAAHPGADSAGLTWANMRHWKRGVNDTGKATTADERAADKLRRLTEKYLKGVSPQVIFRALGLIDPGLMPELSRLHFQHSENEAYRADPFPRILSEAEEHPEF